MDDSNLLFSLILQRFLQLFGNVTYCDISIAKHLYFPCIEFFRREWGMPWLGANPEYVNCLKNEFNGRNHWTIEPYEVEPHLNGKILFQGAFGSLAKPFLPDDRWFLLCKNREEVQSILAGDSGLSVLCLEDFCRPHPDDVNHLKTGLQAIIAAQTGDPIFGSPKFSDWISTQLPDLTTRFKAVREIFNRIDISAVLTISTIEWFGNLLTLTAKARKIPSILLQHGVVADGELFCHLPMLSAKKAVWGAAVVEWHRQYGIPPNRFCMTGSPRFDPIFNRQWVGREKLRRTLDIKPDQAITVYATQAFAPSHVEIMADTVAKGIKDRRDVYLIVLLHLNENPAAYQPYFGEIPNCRICDFGQLSLYDALSGADLFITCCSTAAMEAMLFQVPVLIVEPFAFRLYFSYGDLNAAPTARSATELNEILHKIIYEPDFRRQVLLQNQEFITHYCIPDGQATSRLISELDLLRNLGGTL